MSFSYSEISSNTEKGGKRVYHTKDGDYPSITTILGATADKTWLYKWQDRIGKEAADKIKTESATQGTKVHKHLENHFAGKEVDLSNATEHEAQMFRTMRVSYESDITKVHGQEVCLFSNELKYAGRCDMVGDWQGELAIIDFKTAKKPKKKEWIKDYYLQTLGYALAHDEMYGTNIKKGVVLITIKEDLPQCFIIDFTKELWMYEELGNRIVSYYRGLNK